MKFLKLELGILLVKNLKILALFLLNMLGYAHVYMQNFSLNLALLKQQWSTPPAVVFIVKPVGHKEKNDCCPASELR